MEPDDLFDMSSLSSLSLRNSFDFYSSEATTLQDLLQVESILLRQDDLFAAESSTSSSSPPHAIAPLLRSCDTNSRSLGVVREQCYGQLVPGVALSRPAVLDRLVVFGTEDIQSSASNSVFMVDSVFSSCRESRSVLVSGPVTALSFVSEAGRVVVGTAGGAAVLIRASDGDIDRPVPISLGHSDDIRDFALMQETQKTHLASCSFDGSVIITDLIHGCAPILKVQ